MQVKYQISVVKSCDVASISRTAYYYEPKLSDDDEIIHELNRLTERHHRWGFPKCFSRLRKLGYHWNHKRVYHVYTELKLNMRRKSKKRLPNRSPKPLAPANAPGKSWSIDFMSDRVILPFLMEVRYRILRLY